MRFERWIVPRAGQAERSLLVPEGPREVDLGGGRTAVALGPAIGAASLAQPLRMAIEKSSAPLDVSPLAFMPVTLSFSPVLPTPSPSLSDESSHVLLHFSELLTTWARLVPEVGAHLVSIEAVEFGRIELRLTASHDDSSGEPLAWDQGVSLALLAVALDELALQRGLAAKALRLDTASSTFQAGVAWVAHLALRPRDEP